MDFFYFRFPDINSLSRAQALEIRDECLSNIRVSLEDKERYLSEQIQSIKEEMRLKVFIFIRYDFTTVTYLGLQFLDQKDPKDQNIILK